MYRQIMGILGRYPTHATRIPRARPHMNRNVVAYFFGAFAARSACRLHPACSADAGAKAVGADFTDKLPRIAEAVRSLPVEDALLDGEAVAFKPDGHSDFTALRTTRGAAQASFVAFDLLRFEGEDWRKLPLEVRRAQLGSLVAGIDGLTFSEALDADGAIVFAHACELGLEGIVSKRLGGVYSSGRCRNWVKVRNPAFKRR